MLNLLQCPRGFSEEVKSRHSDKLVVRTSENNGTESNRLIPTFAIEDEERDPVHMHHGMTVLPVIPTKLLVGILMLLLHCLTKNEELGRVASERRTNFLLSERRTIQR